MRAISAPGESVSSRRWQDGGRDCRRSAQVPKRLISPVCVAEPFALRVPPEILRAITAGRRLRSVRHRRIAAVAVAHHRAPEVLPERPPSPHYS